MREILLEQNSCELVKEMMLFDAEQHNLHIKICDCDDSTLTCSMMMKSTMKKNFDVAKKLWMMEKYQLSLPMGIARFSPTNHFMVSVQCTILHFNYTFCLPIHRNFTSSSSFGSCCFCRRICAVIKFYNLHSRQPFIYVICDGICNAFT